MPLEPAVLGDAAARPGPDGVPRIRSHRFLGGNTALAALRNVPDNGLMWVVAALVITWGNDTMAYFAGRLFAVVVFAPHFAAV